MTDQLDRYIKENERRFVDELRELCAIPCEHSDRDALRRAATWCGQRIAAAGLRAREIKVDSVPALVVGEGGAGKRTLIAVQHYDVQPAVPLELWETPPYEPALRDGAVYARGVSDNKGHLLLRIQAVEAHRAVFGELPIRLRFLIEGEEESGSVNLGRLLERDPSLVEGDAALKEGGGIDQEGRPHLSLGNKGIFYCELRVRTMAHDAHSGGAPYLPNASWRLVDALGTLLEPNGRIRIAGFYDAVREPTREERAAVKAAPFEPEVKKRIYQIDRFAFGRDDDAAREASVFAPTCNICGVWSGYIAPGTKTVIPSEAAAKIDFRLVPDQDPAEIARLLRRHLDANGFGDVELIAHEGEHPYRGPLDDPLVRAAKAVAEEAFGKPAAITPNSGGTAPMWLVSHKHKLANVTLGMGHPGSGAHAPNENVVLKHYWRALRATARLYSEYAKAV